MRRLNLLQILDGDLQVPEIGIVVPLKSTFRPPRRRLLPVEATSRMLLGTTHIPVVGVKDALLLVSFRRRTVRVLPLPVRVVLRQFMVVISVQIQATVGVISPMHVSGVY